MDRIFLLGILPFDIAADSSIYYDIRTYTVYIYQPRTSSFQTQKSCPTHTFPLNLLPAKFTASV